MIKFLQCHFVMPHFENADHALLFAKRLHKFALNIKNVKEETYEKNY